MYPLKVIGDCPIEKTGTKVVFFPDDTIFEEITFDYQTLKQRLRETAFLTKDLKIIKKIPTKYWSFFIAFILLCATNIVMNTFMVADIILYLLTSISISLGSNVLSNFNKGNKEDSK